MIKILHTSDLHIGKRLYQYELAENHKSFFKWLTTLIKDEEIDALIIAGDIFDVANPSSESRKIYYDLLLKLSQLKCKVIIAGGNHDSPSMLAAPSDLLKMLDIHVTGNMPDDPSDLLIPLNNKNGKPEAIIASVPYLRDADLRKHSEEESYEDRVEAVRSGIIKVYREIASLCKELYPGLPSIAMGHLFVQGSKLSESERDIQIGNLAGVQTDKLPDYFDYYALGHLHNPQSPENNGKIIYSGSPIQLSFSERKNTNRLILYTISNNKITAETIEVPGNYKLLKVAGTIEAIDNKLYALKNNPTEKKLLIEVDALEETNDPSKVIDLETLIGEFSCAHAEILKYRIKFNNQEVTTSELYDTDTSIEELKPQEVFNRKLDIEGIDKPTGRMLKEAFAELLEEVLQSQSK